MAKPMVVEEVSRAGEFEGEDMDTPEDQAWRDAIHAMDQIRNNSAEKFDIVAGILAWLNGGKGSGN